VPNFEKTGQVVRNFGQSRQDNLSSIVRREEKRREEKRREEKRRGEKRRDDTSHWL
jgi:hypothetical protein